MTASTQPSQRPTFWPQGVLILLPVALLAGAGLSFLRIDRRLAEQEARQRAEEIAQQCSKALGRPVAGALTEFEAVARAWNDFHQYALAAWPGSPMANDWTNSRATFDRNLAELRQKHPALSPEQSLIGGITLDEAGALCFPSEWRAAPLPPGWLAEFSSDQSQAWHAAQTTEFTGAAAPEALVGWQRFLEAEPAAEARANAEFAVARLLARTNSPAAAIAALCLRAGRDTRVTTPSGLPLATVAVAAALALADEETFDERLFERLREQVFSTPSFLTPCLLEQAEQRVRQAPHSVQAAVGALRACWIQMERRRELAHTLRQQHPGLGILTTNWWLAAPTGRWLAILSPSEILTHTSVAGQPVTLTNPVTRVRFFPKPVVERAFAEALRSTAVPLPAYFSLQVELEGEPLSLTDSSEALGRPLAAGSWLARTEGVLTQPATMLLNEPQPGADLRTGPEFESLPSRPAYRVSLHLADPARLFARQRQRTLWFGALIVGAAVTALIGFVAAWRAFSKQQRLAAMKSNFVSSVSHELRAPIASVRLMAESLERGKIKDAAQQGEYFRMIGQESRRLSALIENVLDFARIEQGRKQYEFEPTDLVALVEATVKLMEPYANERGVRLALSTPAPLPSPLNLDSRALQQALINLLDNAVKHSPSSETVSVSLEVHLPPDRRHSAFGTPHSAARDQAFCLLSSAFFLTVADHGPGIPPEDHERIFELFYRRGSELRRETQGVGIGLSIVKHVVEAHGGHVTVASALGQGSRFTIALPLEANERIH